MDAKQCKAGLKVDRYLRYKIACDTTGPEPWCINHYDDVVIRFSRLSFDL
ncbi:Uncharacterised protein [Klebsiella michiganensis]|nr:Uncharacterised protein [Klebsiella michiganensis]